MDCISFIVKIFYKFMKIESLSKIIWEIYGGDPKDRDFAKYWMGFIYRKYPKDHPVVKFWEDNPN